MYEGAFVKISRRSRQSPPSDHTMGSGPEPLRRLAWPGTPVARAVKADARGHHAG